MPLSAPLRVPRAGGGSQSEAGTLWSVTLFDDCKKAGPQCGVPVGSPTPLGTCALGTVTSAFFFQSLLPTTCPELTDVPRAGLSAPALLTAVSPGQLLRKDPGSSTAVDEWRFLLRNCLASRSGRMPAFISGSLV